MSDTVITVKNLSKMFAIGMAQPKYRTLRDHITESVGSLFQRNGKKPASTDIIWALKDVSFGVKRGEVLGIIGRNGAGKSTLLKILSRITNPTEGSAKIRGRVGSLLEVGTGFHPELTGRENIYLNGAILGMKKTDIDRKFDEIVAFSEVEKFIDTPVKHYSSGMHVRLAFAVAAHLEPEILIVDEVLAVGDAEFQRKCLNRMENVTKEGRTVLFVSHNMAAVQSLCTRAIYLRDGQIVQDGPVDQTMTTYLNSVKQQTDGLPLADRRDRVGGDRFRIVRVEFLDAKTGDRMQTLLSGQDVLIRMHFECLAEEPFDKVSFAIAFFAVNGTYLFSCNSEAIGVLFNVDYRAGISMCRIPKWPLTAGRYTFNVLAARERTELDWVKEAGYVDVETGDFYGTAKLPGGSKTGVLIDYQWDSSQPASPASQMSKADEEWRM
jgi:lipopolysaccharide transport system ATP-binding protein